MGKELKNGKRAEKMGIIVCMILIVCAVLFFVLYMRYMAEIKRNMAEMDEIVAQVKVETEAITETVSTGTDMLQPSAIQEKPMHDFEALKQINEDVYAWITIPGTQVDYPILQSTTDNKYLNTNIDGSSGYPGCIYSNVCNSKEFDDYITVLYGHNMKTGEMFGSLHDFNEEDFFREFETYTIETEKARFTYSVYAAVNYNDKLIPAYYDVKRTSGRDAFLESLEPCRENSLTHFNDAIEISGEDKVLVLSVCIKGQEDRRYLIVSKLEEKVIYE